MRKRPAGGLGQLVQHKKTAVVVVVEKGVALQRLPLAVERVMDAAHLDEELSARLEARAMLPRSIRSCFWLMAWMVKRL